MDSNCKVEVFFRNSFENRHCVALGHFSCMWTQEMQPDYPIIFSLINNYLGIAVLSPIFIKVPL